MSLSAEEQQRLDMILDFLSLHRMRIILVSAVLVLATGAWAVYGAVSKSRIEESSAYLFSLNEAIEGDNDEAVDEAFRRIIKVGVPDYIEQAGMVVAGHRFWKGDKDGAAEAYRVILDASNDLGARGLARLRLAQVLIDSGKLDDALAVAENHDHEPDSTMRMLLEEVSGDALAAKGDIDGAVVRYSTALQLLKPTHGPEYETMIISKLGFISQQGVDLAEAESDG